MAWLVFSGMLALMQKAVSFNLWGLPRTCVASKALEAVALTTRLEGRILLSLPFPSSSVVFSLISVEINATNLYDTVQKFFGVMASRPHTRQVILGAGVAPRTASVGSLASLSGTLEPEVLWACHCGNN
jgi:hypothetical protein